MTTLTPFPTDLSPNSVLNDIMAAAGAFEPGDTEFLHYLEPIIGAESSFNPQAVSSGGYAGLLQLGPTYGEGMPPADFKISPTAGGGYHGPYSQSQLLDPMQNLVIGTSPIAAAYEQGKTKGLSGKDLENYIALHSGHDSWTGTPTGNNPTLIPTIDAYFDAYNSRPQADTSIGGQLQQGVQNVAGLPGTLANKALSATGSAIGEGISSGLTNLGYTFAGWVKGNGFRVMLFVLAVFVVIGAANSLMKDAGVEIPKPPIPIPV